MPINQSHRASHSIADDRLTHATVARIANEIGKAHAHHATLMLWRIVATKPGDQTRIIGPIASAPQVRQCIAHWRANGFAVYVQRARWDTVDALEPAPPQDETSASPNEPITP